MKKKLLIIGKNSFISISIKNYLKKNLIIKSVSYVSFLSLKLNYIKKFDFIINCSINNNYINKKYNIKNDLNFIIADKIKNLRCTYVFLSTRKVYSANDNILETSFLKPKCNYSKNKLKTEIILKKILKDRVLILRLSNLIGKRAKKNLKRKKHNIFVDHFFYNIKKNIITDNKKIYKDFISIKQFAIIFKKLISCSAKGTYNVSIGEKVYLNNVINWLNYYNSRDIKLQKPLNNYNKDCFYLNNKKLEKKIGFKIKKSDLKKDCMEISKKHFNK